jgi:mono/diheme cytochrome c family protein
VEIDDIMKLSKTTFSNIVFPSIVFGAAILLTALLATASLRAAGGGREQLVPPKAPAGLTAQQLRGKYLVDIMGCHDCHTPMKIGPKGPEPDTARALSGHPADAPMPPNADVPPGYLAMIGMSFTSFKGPWGTSFTRNLTPDKETGLGDWTVDEFIATMKTGRERGKGRPVLPPMPVQNLRHLSDADIRAVFTYLQSLPPVKNQVPQPIE